MEPRAPTARTMRGHRRRPLATTMRCGKVLDVPFRFLSLVRKIRSWTHHHPRIGLTRAFRFAPHGVELQPSTSPLLVGRHTEGPRRTEYAPPPGAPSPALSPQPTAG